MSEVCPSMTVGESERASEMNALVLVLGRVNLVPPKKHFGAWSIIPLYSYSYTVLRSVVLLSNDRSVHQTYLFNYCATEQDYYDTESNVCTEL